MSCGEVLLNRRKATMAFVAVAVGPFDDGRTGRVHIGNGPAPTSVHGRAQGEALAAMASISEPHGRGR